MSTRFALKVHCVKVLQEIKHNRTVYSAKNFIQNDPNCDILLIPFLQRQIDAWRGGEHYTLGALKLGAFLNLPYSSQALGICFAIS